MPDSSKIYGLIGHPLVHSFSKKYFTEKFKAEGIDSEYLNFDIDSVDRVDEIIKVHENLIGFNVTIPYKQQIIDYLDEISEESAEIGAVNVVKIYRNEYDRVKLKGFNTDITGFSLSIMPYLNKSHRRALILGTGGASKAIDAGLRKLGIKTTFVSRRPGERKITYGDLTENVMREHTVIVNCTPLGTFPETDTCPPIPYQFVTGNHLCFDLVYNPPITKFIKLCSEKGAMTLNGAEMLRIQAEEAWKIWTK